MLYREAISKSIVDAMAVDPKVVLLGQNVTAPHGVFGTTTEAFRRFPERVLEIPVSETMVTGACVGMAMEGYKPILVHTRADFSLFSFEHLVNTAAKLPFLHGKPLPFVVRVVVGRGWGQGPVHSQSFHHMLAQVPGLNVVVPSTPLSYEWAMQDALREESPTVIVEPRRLYDTEDILLSRSLPHSLSVVLIPIGDTVLEAVEAQNRLIDMGIGAEVWPWEWLSLPIHRPAPVASILIDMAPRRPEPGVVAPPFTPQGVSQPYERMWYPTADDIVAEACRILRREVPQRKESHGVYAPAGSPF